MTLAIEILKDGSEVTYESDDIDEYDDLFCISDDNLPPIDLTKVKDVDIEAERVNSEVAYKEIISDSRSFAKGYHYTQTRSYEPVSVEHSIYYAYLKFEGQRKRRKFILDEEIVNKIYLIQQIKNLLANMNQPIIQRLKKFKIKFKTKIIECGAGFLSSAWLF